MCKDLLNFLVDTYATPKNLQIIICSHSPEILTSALDREDCSLYHLESEKLLTKVRYQDQDVISDALKKLGTTAIEGLLHKGTILVEGPDDIALLEAGFGDMLRKYKLKDLGGRPEIEKQIVSLQETDKTGQNKLFRAFIFDRDDAPTNLVSTDHVRVQQWRRRCFENYLIDFDVLADLLMDRDFVTKPLNSAGEVQNVLKELAKNQLDEIAARNVYQTRNYESPGMRKEDVRDVGFTQISENLFNRINRVREQLKEIDEQNWKRDFIKACEQQKTQLEQSWDSKWQSECDGKRLIKDLHNRVQPRPGGLQKFKKRIMQEMRFKNAENWLAIKAIIEETLKIPSRN